MPEALLLVPRAGATLADLLFERGVEFPCGGVTNCGNCRVRVLEGEVPVTDAMREALSGEEIAAGWRLGCRAQSAGPVTLAIEQWDAAILSNDSPVKFEPGEGHGIVVDLGTTTLVAQLLDLACGTVCGVESILNPQARYGADVMSRIEFDLREPGRLAGVIREAIGGMVATLAGARRIREVVLAGNTAMHHLFCGIDARPLAAAPFESSALGEREFQPAELGWRLDASTRVRFLPCIGGFVGSDILAGILATGVADSEATQALLDLGTNGEIAAGSRAGLWVASTAAGPAFEAGRIRMGMRAASGAVHRVEVRDGAIACHVIGGGPARGICGSGLVDAAAVLLECGQLLPNGRVVSPSREVALDATLKLYQSDLRELQLAKGAIAAGLATLRAMLAPPLERIHLSGAFGNYVQVASARRIGLLPPDAIPVTAAGNSSLHGLKMLMLAPARAPKSIARILGMSRHVSLSADRAFQERFAAAMAFPQRAAESSAS